MNEFNDFKIKGRPITCRLCGHQWRFEKEKDRNVWRSKKLCCPKCNEQYCILPKSERKLRKIQDEYLISRDINLLGDIYSILRSYAESLIKKNFANTKYFQAACLDEYSHDAASLFVEQYQVNEDFKIKISFGKYLTFKIRQVIFGKQNHLIADESLNYMFDDGNYVEHEDKNYLLLNIIEDEDNKNNLSEYISEIIFEIEDWCSCKKENYIRLLNVYNYLYNGERLPEKFFSVYKAEQEKRGENQHLGSFIFMKTIDIVRLELLELHKLHNTIADSFDRQKYSPVL